MEHTPSDPTTPRAMPGTTSPPEQQHDLFPPASPSIFHHATTSSSLLGISSFDGTPRYLFPSSPSPPPRASSPSLDMAITPLFLAGVSVHLPLSPNRQSPEHQPSSPPSADGPEMRPVEPALPLLNLSQLAQSLRRRDYQRRRCDRIQSHLRAIQVWSAHTARLVQTAQTIQPTLAECIKSEDKQSFSNLFNAFLDTAASAATSQPADGAALQGSSADENERGYEPSALDLVSPASRESLLDLCSRVSYDGNYIADCLATLSHKELLAMLPDRNPSRSNESVFGSSSWQTSRTSRTLGFAVDAQMELLASSDCPSPLHTLFSCARSISGSSVAEDSRVCGVWATVCARLIADLRPGSDKLVPAVLDILAHPPTWPGRARLDEWLSRILAKGVFLTEQKPKQSFRSRVQGRPETSAEDQAAAEAFLHESVVSLLEVLGDAQGPSVIPLPVLRMCRAISDKLDLHPGSQRAFPHFVVTRWLFSSFIPDIISLPEAHGLAGDVFVPDNARHRVLREIVVRAQKTVFDVCYAWKHGNTVPTEVTLRVQAIMTRMVNAPELQGRLGQVPEQEQPGPREDETSFMAVSTTDLASMVKSMFPQRRPASFIYDGDTPPSGLHSSSSSVSGFSLFRNGPSLQPTSDTRVPWPQELPRSGSGVSMQTVHGNSDVGNDSSPAYRSVWMDSHGESLREACAAIEDLPMGGGARTWIFLVMRPGQSASCTTLEDLAKISTNGHKRQKPEASRIERSRCAKSIEDLLLTMYDSENINQSGPLDAPETDFDVCNRLRRGYKDQIVAAEQRGDFLGAYSWSQQLRDFTSMVAGGENIGQLRATIKEIEHSVSALLSENKAVIDVCERWIALLKPALESSTRRIAYMVDVSKKMRDKMWFVADVRTSAAYDEARSVAAALRIMAKPKRQQHTRTPPPLRHWSTSKLSNGNLHLKSEAQILELLSTPPLQGGPNKLSDDQSKTTAQWMERNNIENLCHGEERLHRLCLEIRKCVDQLIPGDSAILWTSPLFTCEKLYNTTPASPSLAALQGTVRRMAPLTLRTNVAPSIDTVSSTSHPLSSVSSRDYLDARSPALTHRSSAAFWSPTTTELQSPSSATSVGSTQIHFRPTATTRHGAPADVGAQKVDALRQSLTSFLLSDIAFPLFNEGSETDQAFWTGIGGELTERHLRTLSGDASRTLPTDPAQQVLGSAFDFKNAFRRLLDSFSVSQSPCVKLKLLHELDRLLSLQALDRSDEASTSHSSRILPDQVASSRSRVTLPTADVNVRGFRQLFSDTATRPPAIFRDLQYIVALTPCAVLETTPQGKAFWNAAIAILGLKQELRTVMVETADSIIAYHSNNRGHGRSASVAQLERDSATFSTPSRTPSAEDVARYAMSDAASLLQITAREGDHVAQRELATLYLTHPELMDHILAPFARSRDVFKEELENKWRRNQDPDRCDPTTMCVAHHWMSLSSKGGDALAKEFLRQREELSDF